MVEMGIKVYIANPRKTALISQNNMKTDKMDACLLARLVRSDPELLYPVTARDMTTQKDLTLIKSRSALVKARGDLIRHLRGVIKPFGIRFPDDVTPDNIHEKGKDILDKENFPAFRVLLDAIKTLTSKIKVLDKQVASLIKKKYPEANNLQTINGVGPITSLTFVLLMGDPKRFKKSRDVGAYFGLVPRRDQSGDVDRPLSITKTGDNLMRSLLVNCSHYILGCFGKDTQLRRHGLKIMGDGGSKIRKKKAVIAVTRKLAVLMHSMLVSGEPFKNKVA
jgi:transposase